MFQIYKQSTVSVSESCIMEKDAGRNVRAVVSENLGQEVVRFIDRFGDANKKSALVTSTSNALNIRMHPRHQIPFFVNLEQLNNAKRVCGFLKEINLKMSEGGLFIGCLETTHLRRKRIYAKYSGFSGRIYYFFDYLIKRVAPSLRSTRWIYRMSAAGRNHAMSYYEMVGRLSYCGLQIESDRVIGGMHYFAARKVASPPVSPRENYNLTLCLSRVGKGRQRIRVYKFRTMVPFSEYVQEHIYKRNKLREGGKFKNDRRVTILGGILRKFWLDELPMVVNILKGDIKLVGVRPISDQYLSLYKPEVIRLRTSVKPGLVPPYYVDLPSSLDEIQESEVRYIERWKKAPFKTDLIYFLKALWNIICCGARSK
ncbi:sugar transferase [Marinilabilia rubra]|uniref:Sugar transferase n=1 Tax=Marinilabilia rubra TaxID=2162893 RepID=A0A2U2BBB9_9BACT|nr:sugar transferase [Marinilabilia rubra]PWE00360.1 sugar transferase [Marinilabilia rubra]